MRRRRRQRVSVARYAAPVAFLAAITVAVLLVRAGLNSAADATETTIPVSTAAATTSATRTTPKRKPARKPKPVYHEVEAGDTFGTIAAQYETSVEALQALNPGVSTNSLTIGQRIRVK